MSRSPTRARDSFEIESKLLILCARTRMSAETAERIRELVENGLNWQVLTEAAAAHGVMPLLCHHLLAMCPERIPDEWRARLRIDFGRIAQRNLFLTSQMLRLSARFRGQGLSAIPYKGPLLAAQAYGNLTLRQFADLDFAIRQRDLPTAAAILAEEGFEAGFGKITASEASQATHSEYQFIRAEPRVIVEMQTETTLRYFPRPLDFDSLERRLREVPLADGEARAFSPEDTLILLAVHGAKHFWERLMWIADISELIQAAGGMSWDEVFALAKEMNVGRMVRLALAVAHQMLDAPLPESVLQQLRIDSTAQRLAGEIRARFSITAETRLPVFARFRFRVATRDNFLEGLRYGIRLATSPTEPDRADVPLPKHFSGIHALLRPLLLMWRHGIRGSNSRDDD